MSKTEILEKLQRNEQNASFIHVLWVTTDP